MPILKYGSPDLRKVSQPVDHFNHELGKLVENMIETMYSAPGIGLAACQVGINIRLTTMDLSVGDDSNQLITVCNPEIIFSEGVQKGEEGCLSIPELTENVVRPRKLRVRGLTIHGDEIEFEAEDLLARCVCHEIDHFNGVFFFEHLSSLKRSLLRNKIKKLAKSGDW